MPNLNLKDISTNDMLDEVCGRFDHAVFAGKKILSANPMGKYEMQQRTKGDFLICMGLGKMAADLAKSKLDEGRKEKE